jgi:hypothetical protein
MNDRPFMAWQGQRGSFYDVYTAEDLSTTSDVRTHPDRTGKRIVVTNAAHTIATPSSTSPVRLYDVLGKDHPYVVASETDSTQMLTVTVPVSGPVFVVP